MLKCKKKYKKTQIQDFNIYPNILYADADTDADMDAGGKAIALLH